MGHQHQPGLAVWWIAVLIVHVGCIIEAQPSKTSSSGGDDHDKHNHDLLVPSASQSALYTSNGRNTLTSTKHSFHIRSGPGTSTRAPSVLKQVMSTSTTTPSPTLLLESSMDFDSCTGKTDGYYPNLGSDCTSYYFCAAGYQITYVCPPGQRFDGKRCDGGYDCPLKPNGFHNPCGKKSNGYYPNNVKPSTYFYCFQQAKVVELQCDPGKVFVNGKCITGESQKKTTTTTESPVANAYLPPITNDACEDKPNGFYTVKSSGCKVYYFCIGQEKTELQCQLDYLFNGDICVHKSRFECRD